MKHIFTLILISFVAISCIAIESKSKSTSTKVFKSPYKVKTFSEREVRKIVEYVVDATGINLPGWSIHLVDTYLVIFSEKDNKYKLIDGIAMKNNKTILIFAYNECLADSSLIKSLGEASDFSPENDFFQKLLEEIKKTAINDLCPPGYISNDKPDPSLMKDIIKQL